MTTLLCWRMPKAVDGLELARCKKRSCSALLMLIATALPLCAQSNGQSLVSRLGQDKDYLFPTGQVHRERAVTLAPSLIDQANPLLTDPFKDRSTHNGRRRIYNLTRRSRNQTGNPLRCQNGRRAVD